MTRLLVKEHIVCPTVNILSPIGPLIMYGMNYLQMVYMLVVLICSRTE